MYFAGKLVYLIVRPSNQLAVKLASFPKFTGPKVVHVLLCHLQNLAAHRDHFVRRLSVRPLVPNQTYLNVI